MLEALFPFWGQGGFDSVDVAGRGCSLVSSRLARTLALLDLVDGAWPMAELLALHCMPHVSTVGTWVELQLPLAGGRKLASMARRFRLHDGGTRRRLGNPCKQMQMQMHARAVGIGSDSAAERDAFVDGWMDGGGRCNDGARATRHQTGRREISLACPAYLGFFINAARLRSKLLRRFIFCCFFTQFLVPFLFLVLQYVNAHGKQHGIRLSTLEGFPCRVSCY